MAVLVLELAQRPAGRRDDLQGADHPPAVVGMEPHGGHRVERRQPCMQGRVTLAVGLVLERSTERGVGPRSGEQTPKQRLEVERGPPDKKGTLAARLDLGDCRQGPVSVLGDAGRFPGVEHVDQVMRNSSTLRQRRLGGADVHPAVERHRIEGDDLGPEPARQRNANRRLAYRGRACQVNRSMQWMIEHVVHHPGIAALRQAFTACADGAASEKTSGIGPGPDADQNRGRFVT